MNQKDIDALFSALNSGDSRNMEKIGKSAAQSLSEEQRKTVDKALSDPEFLNSVLSSEKAQSILKKLQGGKE
ncbi:MAG: hypothetical protein E7573_01515 [Ruminococcaceae bacterium]|nr:hypothetical protein [Oscillospiraceae bacterium]MBR3597677.1 hypothetical protein [Clostridia bacterium]